MTAINLFDYPDDFIDSGTNCLWYPHNDENPNDFGVYLYVENNSVKKQIKWKDHPNECIPTVDKKVQMLKELQQLILRTVLSEEEYKKLPKPRGSYL